MKRLVIGAVLGAAAARTAYTALTRRPPGLSGRDGQEVWGRTNHRGEPVTLLEGPAFALGSAAAGLLVPGVPGRLRAAAFVAGAGSGAFGAFDDLAGSASSRGFKGHLGALARGEVTTGAVKILGIGATGLAAAALAPSRGATPFRRTLDTLVNGALVAASANLMNLFDLRPGRAIKVGMITGVPLAAGAGSAVVAAPLGAAFALLPEDLGERAMLGDAGANAFGALLGLAASRLPVPVRLAVLAGVVGLNAASEKVSFTKVIRETPFLDRIDMLGRRPLDAAPAAPLAAETTQPDVSAQAAAAVAAVAEAEAEAEAGAAARPQAPPAPAEAVPAPAEETAAVPPAAESADGAAVGEAVDREGGAGTPPGS